MGKIDSDSFHTVVLNVFFFFKALAYTNTKHSLKMNSAISKSQRK